MQPTKTGDHVHVRTSGFPVDVDTSPASLEPWHLPHMAHAPNDAASNEAARVAGARMGGGNLEPSEPMPLAAYRGGMTDEQHERTPQAKWSRVADLVMAAIAAVSTIALVFGR